MCIFVLQQASSILHELYFKPRHRRGTHFLLTVLFSCSSCEETPSRAGFSNSARSFCQFCCNSLISFSLCSSSLSFSATTDWRTSAEDFSLLSFSNSACFSCKRASFCSKLVKVCWCWVFSSASLVSMLSGLLPDSISCRKAANSSDWREMSAMCSSFFSIQKKKEN